MGHTPLGYKIENGAAVIDTENAEKIKKMFDLYLSGLGLAQAANSVGLNKYHCTVKKMLKNNKYMGDDFYPAIVEAETFEKVQAEIYARAEKLGRTNASPKERNIFIPTKFRLAASDKYFDDPMKQAEYMYSLIESEVV